MVSGVQIAKLWALFDPTLLHIEESNQWLGDNPLKCS